jgi:DNA-binding XRE family transcriptional regulator
MATNRLKEFRETKLHISQREFSKLSGISPVTICKLERGKIEHPRFKTMLLLSALFHEPVEKVFPELALCVTGGDLVTAWTKYVKNRKISISSNCKKVVDEFLTNFNQYIKENDNDRKSNPGTAKSPIHGNGRRSRKA